MTELNHIAMIETVKAMRKSVDLSYERCETAFARRLHATFLNKLDDMMDDLRHDAKRLTELRQQLQAAEISEEDFNLLTDRMDFEWNWRDDGPHSLLDQIRTTAWGDGEECVVIRDYTVVPAVEQEGLAEFCEQLRKQTGVTFVAARV